jgi:hypothetical protein
MQKACFSKLSQHLTMVFDEWENYVYRKAPFM